MKSGTESDDNSSHVVLLREGIGRRRRERRHMGLVNRVVQTSSTMFLRLRLRGGGTCGPDVKAHGFAIVTVVPGSKIEVGARTSLVSRSSLTALGVPRPVILRTITSDATITIGADCGLSGAVVVAAGSVTIGERCLLGSGVVVADTDFHSVDSVPRRYSTLPPWDPKHAVVIGDDVFLGAGVIVLKGVHVGRGSVVGAGSVVTSDVPPYSVAAGNPAVLVRQLRGSKDE